MSELSQWVDRKRRIVGRFINRKTLPEFTYRWDARAPATIRKTGFQPWNSEGNISLMEHVNNAYPPGHDRAGRQTRPDSQRVSTGAYGMLKNLDATFAQRLHDTIYLYKINTNAALETGEFIDANDHFDKAGVNRPYPTQREYTKSGGIGPNAVIAYMAADNYHRQLNEELVAPDEHLLEGWQAF